VWELTATGGGSVVTAATVSAFPASGSASNLYITTEDQRIWRWDSTASIYVESGPIGGGLALASVPASAFATGTAGQIAADGSHWYYCSAPSTWVRTALSTWTPVTAITGLQAWYDASDASTLFDATTGGSLVAADGGVARWEDRSGNGRHFTQSTSGSRPLRKTAIQGGKAVLRFDGSNDFMSVANSTATFSFLHATNSTIFAVLDANRSGYAPFLSTFDTGSVNVGIQLETTNGSGTADKVTHRVGRGVTGTNTAQQTTGNAFLGSSFNVISVVTQPANATAASRSSIRRDGGTASTASASTDSPSSASSQYNLSLATDNYLGGGSGDATYSSMDIAELIIYDTALSNTDRSAVEQYLISKWGIT
jgi:hypothetical protein